MEPKDIQRALLKFFNDPEWYLVEDLLSKKAKDLDRVSTIDINLPAETIKAIVAGRQETLNLLDEFHRDVIQTRGISNNQPTSFK